jgi:hypothetical protein
MCYLCYLCLLVDSDVQHILYFVCPRLVCAVLPVSLVCPFGFSSVYLDGSEPHLKCNADSSKCFSFLIILHLQNVHSDMPVQ